MDKTENTIREKETEEPEHMKKRASTVSIALEVSTVYAVTLKIPILYFSFVTFF